MLLLKSSILLIFTLAAATGVPHILSDEYIELINSKQSLWKAGRNYPEDTPLEYLHQLCGTFLGGIPDDYSRKIHDADIIASLPEHFDPRDKWQNCPSLHEIRDQGGCGSCWAFGAVEAMTDRWCIHSNGSQFHFSAQDMAGCVYDQNGCRGGFPINAWSFWQKTGIVSGGNYNSKQGCKPYEIHECLLGHDPDHCPNIGVVRCSRKCQEGYNVNYNDDKRFGLKPYMVQGEDNIKAELYLNGPLEAAFTACPDILTYKTGVYNSTYSPDDRQCRGHAVKLMGWGVENGTKYWLIANSWNTVWGESGFVKFLRGENHMGIEEEIIGGMPKLSY